MGGEGALAPGHERGGGVVAPDHGGDGEWQPPDYIGGGCVPAKRPAEQQLQAFWSGQLAETKQTTEFKTHSLPLARIKRIVKAEAEVPRIGGDVPLLLAKACEMFIKELTLRAWLHTEDNKRRTLQKKDVTAALASTDVFDFLVDSSSDKPKGGRVGLTPPSIANNDDSYGDYCCDDYSPLWFPDNSSSPDLQNVTCDDPRCYIYLHP
ncbi:hypothetical protein BS78_07G074700 [Paspalum vaginatum]|nr:hypothetical protein BS78_07G074700 [Paspalum vaginatum]